MSLPNPADLIRQMAIRLKAHLAQRDISEPRFIGIRTGGVWVAQALLEELGSATDARQRIFDLMCQHCRQRTHRTGGAAVRHLAVDVASNGLFDQRYRDQSVAVGYRRQPERAQPAADSWRGQRDAVFCDSSPARLNLLK